MGPFLAVVAVHEINNLRAVKHTKMVRTPVASTISLVLSIIHGQLLISYLHFLQWRSICKRLDIV
jgi:hypothetical protein